MHRDPTSEFLSLGEVMIELWGRSPLAQATNLERTYSGDVLNIAVAVRRLGLPSAIVTRLGEDPFGDYLMEEWSKLDVNLTHVKRGGGPTGVYVSEYGDLGSYETWYYRKGSAASTISREDIDSIDLDAASMVHISGISQAISDSSRSATHRLAERGHECQKPVSFDLNYRARLWTPDAAREAAEQVIPLTDIFFAGGEEGTTIFGPDDPADLADRALELGTDIAAISLAEQGAYVAWKDGSFGIKPIARRLEGLQGAGDAFAGGFAVGAMLDQEPSTCARLGTVVAGLKVEHEGPLLGLPFKDEVRTRADELGWHDVTHALDTIVSTSSSRPAKNT